MSKIIKKVLNVPEKTENLMNRKRHEKKNWTNIYYYKDNKKTKINNEDVIEYDIVSGGCYKTNVFYKVTHLCKKDDTFDYYKILKPHNKEPVVVLPSKKEKNKKEHKQRIKNVFEIKYAPKNNPFILHF